MLPRNFCCPAASGAPCACSAGGSAARTTESRSAFVVFMPSLRSSGCCYAACGHHYGSATLPQGVLMLIGGQPPADRPVQCIGWTVGASPIGRGTGHAGGCRSVIHEQKTHPFMSNSADTLSVREKIGYSLGDLAANLIFQT